MFISLLNQTTVPSASSTSTSGYSFARPSRSFCTGISSTGTAAVAVWALMRIRHSLQWQQRIRSVDSDSVMYVELARPCRRPKTPAMRPTHPLNKLDPITVELRGSIES